MNENADQQAGPPVNAGKMNIAAILNDRWRLIVTVSAVLAAVIIIAVLVFQIIEFQYYRQNPSVWPATTLSK